MPGSAGPAEMAARCSPADLPAEMLVEILSRLSWRQLLGVRLVSRRWLAAADVSLTRCLELDISRADFLSGLNSEMLESLLQNMPALQRLSVDGRSPGEEMLHVDLVSRHCRHLEEVRLVSFLVDAPAVGRLCDNCPRLQAVSMDCSLDEASVEMLLRRLPGLHSLHLAGARAEGGCLSLLPATLERLTLPDAIHLRPVCFSHLARCPQLRELDLSRTRVRSEELAEVLAACGQLERLAVSGCPELDLAWVRQLIRRPRLRELHMSHMTVGLRYNPDIVIVLATCSQVERLAVAGSPSPVFYFIAENLPGFTHVDLSETPTSDTDLRRLGILLPTLRHLRLFSCRGVGRRADILTATGLAGVLPSFRHLQVLDLRGLKAGCTATVLDSLHGLPLTALACGRSGRRGRSGPFVDRLVSGATLAGLVLTCPELTVFQPVTDPAVLRDAVRILAESLSPDRDVTLIVEPGREPTTRPGLRVVGDSAGLWDDLVDWHWPRKWG